MKLLSQISSKYKTSIYEKFWIVLPIKLVKKLGWIKGQELNAEIRDNALIIKRKTNP